MHDENKAYSNANALELGHVIKVFLTLDLEHHYVMVLFLESIT
jgi:hypothetical protein